MLLADLPDELLVSVFLHLRAEDLYRCIRLSKQIAGIIQGTPRLRYHALLDLYGLEDNEEYPADINEKIEALLLREDAYLNFKYRFAERTTSDGYPSIYDLSSGRFFMGNEEGSIMSVRSATLPTEGCQRITWSEIFVGQSICDFGTAVEEHDLIAFVISLPAPDGLSCDIDVALYQLSGQPHPEAKRPRIHLLRVDDEECLEWGPPSVSVEIVVDTLAVIIYYALDNEHPANRLFLFSWRTGAALNPGGQPVTNVGLCFLTPDLLMHPNEHMLSLDIFRVPKEPSGPDLELVCQLNYPDFNPDALIFNTMCRGDPNPSLNHIHQPGAAARPFRTRVEDSVVLVLMTWRYDRGVEEEVDEEALSLVVHRSTILRHASRGEPVVHWKDWGPNGARWLCMSKMSYSYITTTSGQRYVQKPMIALNAPAQPIHILDFNPHTVRRVEAQLLAQAEEAGEDDGTRKVTIDTPTAIIVLAARHESGHPWVESQRTSREHPWADWPEKAFTRAARMAWLFDDAKELEPGLPFVRTISKQRFAIDVVIMDNERVIGLSTDQTDWTTTTIGIHALYFG